jgi:hypothetical protein
MPYDIQLKDGTIIPNIPDSVDPKDAIAQIKDTKKKTAESSDFGNFSAGVGSGFKELGRNVTNFVLPESLEPEFATDDAIAMAKAANSPLMQTKAGMAGNIGAQVLGSFPVGGAVGAAIKGANAFKSVAGVGGAVKHLNNSKALRSGVEGAVVGAATSAPDQRGDMAVLGGGLGLGMTKAAQTAKRLGSTGLIRRSQDAKKYTKDTGIDLPLASAADDAGFSGGVKTVVNDFMPSIPGFGSPLRAQSASMFQNFRKAALGKAVPKWAKGKIRIEGLNPQETMRVLNRFWKDDAWEMVNGNSFSIANSWVARALDKTAGAATRKSLFKELAKSLDASGGIKGSKLTAKRKELRELARAARMETPPNANLASKYDKMGDAIEDIYENQLSKKQWGEYLDSKKTYGKYIDVQKSTHSGDGMFSPGKLSSDSSSRAGQHLGAEGSGHMQGFGNVADKAMGKGIHEPNFWRYLGTMGLAGSGYVNPALTGTAWIGAKAALSPGGQKTLMGTTNFQKKTAAALRKHHKAMNLTGAGARRAVAATHDDRQDEY